MRIALLVSLPDKITIEGNWETQEVKINGDHLHPEDSLKIRNHSPDGFNWSYGGSGPAQLALSICMLYLPLEEALSVYQDFKFMVVAGWPKSNFLVDLNFREEIKKIIQNRKVNPE